ncbi:MAG: hypothetical protein Q7S31_04140 [bacterium]|nr:hypothetical protein [bacterium]
MATLTEVSYYTRRAVKWAIAAMIIIILTPILWRMVKGIYLKINPPPPPAPTVAYGKLPQLKFPQASKDYQPVMRLETIDGKLPKLATVSRVYVVEVNKSRLLELDRVKARVRSLGFSNEPGQVDEQTFEFVHPAVPATLKVDVIYDTYKYQYDWTLDQAIYSGRSVPNNNQAFVEAKSFFQTLGILGSDLADGKTKVAYFAAQPPQMIPTTSLSEANFIRIDLFRSDRDNLPWVTRGGNTSAVYAIFSGVSDRSKRIVEANYAYSKIVENSFATYPLKTADQAWNELQQGQGYVATQAGPQVVVRRVYLAYYESDIHQDFVQPVFVFEGDSNYLAYVSAIDPAYLQAASPSQSPSTPSQ